MKESAFVYHWVRSFFSHKFQVIARFCPGQHSHSPGFGADNSGTKRQMPKAFLNDSLQNLEKTVSI